MKAESRAESSDEEDAPLSSRVKQVEPSLAPVSATVQKPLEFEVLGKLLEAGQPLLPPRPAEEIAAAVLSTGAQPQEMPADLTRKDAPASPMSTETQAAAASSCTAAAAASSSAAAADACLPVDQHANMPAAQLPDAAVTASPANTLPKPRQPLAHSHRGEDWIKVRIELAGDPVPQVLPTYKFEMEWKVEGAQQPATAPQNIGLAQVFCATKLSNGQKYRFRVRIREDGNPNPGPWSSWSAAMACNKQGRDAIDPAVRRQMWADFYMAEGEHEETGSRLDQPCLGCRARGQKPTMLSPMLTNVDASHVIAASLGGPDDSWNLVPLCPECNRDHQKTENMIDWMLKECDKSSSKDRFLPLFETLVRLQRACVKNRYVTENGARPRPVAHSPPISVAHVLTLIVCADAEDDLVKFACKTYHTGLPQLCPKDDSGVLTFDSGKLGVQGQSGRAGGFFTPEDELTRVLFRSGHDMTAKQMLKRVNLMDSQAQSLQVIAEKLQMSLNDTSDYDEVKRLTDEYRKILDKLQKQIDGLGKKQ